MKANFKEILVAVSHFTVVIQGKIRMMQVMAIMYHTYSIVHVFELLKIYQKLNQPLQSLLCGQRLRYCLHLESGG